ncbi:MAG TPA: urea carboxylase [Propionibacteriaceae bacterium]
MSGVDPLPWSTGPFDTGPSDTVPFGTVPFGTVPFDTVLVANRGEIAVRIIRSAHELGLRTVAVHSAVDAAAPHVRLADQSVLLGPGPVGESYLRADLIIAAAQATGAGAVHPGYGFLSENADFARACEDAGIAFVGPTPEQLELFGTKHTARDAAAAAGVPLLAGTGLLAELDDAVAAAAQIGYPVMLKATAGGGGIGMTACHTESDLVQSWANVRRIAGASFASSGVFLERLVTRARHVEVQVFGDGAGRVVALGDRDCSLQRRHQKVVEEAPAPGLSDQVRATMTEAAVALCASVGYRSAGTVEYVYDPVREEIAFLEVNTRLQVEHPVTEAVFGVDLVAWMLRLAQGDRSFLPDPAVPRQPQGHAVEARVYAENTDLDHLPSAGTVTAVRWAPDARTDTWVEPGMQVSALYDPLLGKVVAHAATRELAWAGLETALEQTRIDGVATNLGLLRTIAADPGVRAAEHSTATLATLVDTSPRFEVVKAGMLTTIQDWPGRTGYWSVGVPPSGPMDDLSFRLGNQALGNDHGAPGLEMTMAGPVLRFHSAAVIMVTGAPTPVLVDGRSAGQWVPLALAAGSTVEIGTPSVGMRTYLLVAGGIDAPQILGSAATFDLGEMGGLAGRALRTGDVVPLRPVPSPRAEPVPPELRPEIGSSWRLGVLEGPHGAPDFFTVEDVAEFYRASWNVHFNSARTGVRLVGPKPTWARRDGGDAGLHPSNIHDTPYAVGAVDYTGDLPILLGPDGPSLGGFTCPATVITAHRWKLGQLRPGDSVAFVPVNELQAGDLRRQPHREFLPGRQAVVDGGVLHRSQASPTRPKVTFRRSGDDNLLIEYGEMVLDISLRMRVHALAEAIAAQVDSGGLVGVIDVTPGIRSLQLHVDPQVVGVSDLLAVVRALDEALPPTHELSVPSRTVRLPLSWDDPATREAITRYMNGVRDDAPWCPWNIEFIRRINGLATVDEVYATVFDAEYLVLGLGDVYLGAPVATPVDPRHRLVTTKYNPARTWTPQNAVGIGGAYLCVYGMEGPGGYQFVGRTVPIWSTLRQRGPFADGVPWLLRFFDRISWYPVSAEELIELRAAMIDGTAELDIVEGTFSMADHQRFLSEHAESIEDFQHQQGAAFAAERLAWHRAGEFDRVEQEVDTRPAPQVVVPSGCEGVEAPFVANVFRVDVEPGDRVSPGQVLAALEAMKMEAPLLSTVDGVVVAVNAVPGTQVNPGDVLVVIERTEAA